MWFILFIVWFRATYLIFLGLRVVLLRDFMYFGWYIEWFIEISSDILRACVTFISSLLFRAIFIYNNEDFVQCWCQFCCDLSYSGVSCCCCVKAVFENKSCKACISSFPALHWVPTFCFPGNNASQVGWNDNNFMQIICPCFQFWTKIELILLAA